MCVCVCVCVCVCFSFGKLFVVEESCGAAWATSNVRQAGLLDDSGCIHHEAPADAANELKTVSVDLLLVILHDHLNKWVKVGCPARHQSSTGCQTQNPS